MTRQVRRGDKPPQQVYGPLHTTRRTLKRRPCATASGAPPTPRGAATPPTAAGTNPTHPPAASHTRPTGNPAGSSPAHGPGPGTCLPPRTRPGALSRPRSLTIPGKPLRHPRQTGATHVTKPRYTIDEHLELGSVLTGIRNELLHRKVDLANAYPRSGPEGTAYRALKQAMEGIEEARCALDSLVHREHPEEAQPAVYYAGDEAAQIAIPRTRRAR